MSDQNQLELEDEDEAADPNPSQLHERIVRAASEQVRSAGPGLVRSADTSAGTVTAQPAVSQVGASSADPSIPDVPLLFLRSSKAKLTFPVSSGDPVLLIHADRSLDEWAASGGSEVVTPTDPRSHDITDAVALPVGPGAGSETDVELECVAGDVDLTATLGSVVLTAGTLVKLAGAASASFAIKGTEFDAALTTLCGFLTAYVQAIATLETEWKACYDPGTGGQKDPWKPIKASLDPFETAQSNLLSGITTFLGLMAAWTSTQVVL